MDMCVESLIAVDAMEWVDLWTPNLACYRHASVRMHLDLMGLHVRATITYTSFLIWLMFSHTSIMIPFSLFIIVTSASSMQLSLTSMFTFPPPNASAHTAAVIDYPNMTQAANILMSISGQQPRILPGGW